MSIWFLVLISFLQITLGGAFSLGFVFYMSAENSPDVTELQNNVLFTLLISFAVSLLVSAALAIYFFATHSPTYYMWFALPWVLLAVLLVYWNLL